MTKHIKSNQDVKPAAPCGQRELALLGDPSFSGRGFPMVDFTDAYGESCSLQCSSAVGEYDDSLERPGSSFVWLGIDEIKPIVMAKDADKVGVTTKETTGWVDYPIPEEVQLSARMHLNREQVSGLIGRLQEWLDNGDFT